MDKTRFKWILMLTVSLAVLVLTILALNYFNILSLSLAFPKQLGWLPHQPTLKPKTSQQTPGLSSSKLTTLSCPVPEDFCQTGKALSFEENPAFGYSLPPETEIFSVLSVVDSTVIVKTQGKEITYRGLRQTAITEESCHTFTYIFPKETIVRKFDLLPLKKGEVLATASAQLMKVGEDKVNFLLQWQKRPLDPQTLGKPDFERCPATNILNPKEAGTYQSINPITFR